MPTRVRRNEDEFYVADANEKFGTKLQNPDYRTDLNAQEDDQDAILADFVGPYPCIVVGLEVEVDPVDETKFKCHAGRGWSVNESWPRRKRRRIVVPAAVSSIEPASSAEGAENVLVARYQETTGDPRMPDWPAPGQEEWDTTETDSYTLMCVLGMENVEDGDIPLGMFRGTGVVSGWKVFDHAPYRAGLADPADKQVQPINWCLNSKFTEAANPSAAAGVTIPDGWGELGATPEKCTPGYGVTGQEGLELKLEYGQGIAQSLKYYRWYILRGKAVYLSFRIQKSDDVGAGDDPVMFRLKNSGGGTEWERLVNLDEVNPGDRIWLKGTVDEAATGFGIEVEHGGGGDNCWFILYDMMLHVGNSPNIPYLPTNCYNVEVREYHREGSIVGDFVPAAGMTYPALVNCHGARLRVHVVTAAGDGTDTYALHVDGVASSLAVDLADGVNEGGAWVLTPISAGDKLKIVGSHVGIPGAQGEDATAVLEIWRWKY